MVDEMVDDEMVDEMVDNEMVDEILCYRSWLQVNRMVIWQVDKLTSWSLFCRLYEGISGKDVIREDVRRMCLWEETGLFVSYLSLWFVI